MDIEYEFQSQFNERRGLIARRIVRLLSANARLGVAEMAKELGISRTTAKKKFDGISGELGINYTLELDEKKLGLASPHLIAIRFHRKPDYGKIRELLLKSYMPQVALVTKGHYDMIIYANSFSSGDYAHWDKSMRILLDEYGAEWLPSEVVHRQLGFFPLRNELIDRSPIAEKYKPLLKALNSNSRTSFQQLSKTLKAHFNTVKYNFDRLVKEGLIKRPTITFGIPKDVCVMSFFSSYTPKSGYEASSARARLAFMSDDRNPLISRYLICAPLIGAHDFFTMGAFDNEKVARSNDIMYHKSVFMRHSVKIQYAVVERILVGSLPIRSVDTKSEYSKIIWTPDFKQ
jgi:DNA-binding Lrp family transcriptional regulator